MSDQRMMSDQQKCDHIHGMCTKRVSWSAVFVGAFVGIGLSFLLNLFSVAIGLSVFTTSSAGLISLAAGGLVGLAIGVIVAMFLAGFTAGYLGRPYCVKRNLGVIYGFTTWCLALVLAALVTTHMGRYMSSYSNFISNPSTIIVMTEDNNKGPAVAASPTNNVVAVDAEKAANTLGLATLCAFVLFLLGAIAACFGGHYGMTCRDND